MKLHIITTQKTNELEINWIEFNTPTGNMVIQEGHAPVIIELSSGYELLYQLKSGQTESMMIVQGVAHVTRAGVKILLPIDL
jgi:F0F1-type ATP synthase epsilon subunit